MNRRWLPGRVAQSGALLLLSEDVHSLRHHCVLVSATSFELSRISPIILDSFELTVEVTWDRSLKHFLRKLKAWNPEGRLEDIIHLLNRIVFVYTSESTEFYQIMNEENQVPRFVVGDNVANAQMNTDHFVLEGSLIWHFMWFLIKISRRTVQVFTQNENDELMDEISQLFLVIVSPFRVQ